MLCWIRYHITIKATLFARTSDEMKKGIVVIRTPLVYFNDTTAANDNRKTLTQWHFRPTIASGLGSQSYGENAC